MTEQLTRDLDPVRLAEFSDRVVKRVGITGAAGFLGSHLTERLVSEGVEVIGVDDLSYGTVANLEPVLGSSIFDLQVFDCARRRELRVAFDGCDTIVHLAAQKIPRYGGALHTLEANVSGVKAAAGVALALDADLIVASTSDVYGNAKPPFREDGDLVIGPPTSRRWAYAVSKLFDEHMCLALAEERGLRVSLLRFFGSYGPRNHPSWWGGPQAAFFEALLNGEMMEIHGDGQQTRTFTFVADTVDGIVRTIRTSGARGEILNIGGTEPTTILDLAHKVQAAVGISEPLRARFIPYESLPGNYQDVRHRVPDPTKAREMLGFEAAVRIEDGLALTCEWHRLQRAGERVAAGALAVAP
jgi:UDP-glucose 4-epimerase